MRTNQLKVLVSFPVMGEESDKTDHLVDMAADGCTGWRAFSVSFLSCDALAMHKCLLIRGRLWR